MKSAELINERLSSMPPEKVRSLLKHSKTLNFLVYFWIIMTVLNGIVLFFPLFLEGLSIQDVLSFLDLEITSRQYTQFVLALLLPNLLVITCVAIRTRFGRVLGIIMCCLNLLSVPIGTIAGILGLHALLSAPELFGKNKISHAQLKSKVRS